MASLLVSSTLLLLILSTRQEQHSHSVCSSLAVGLVVLQRVWVMTLYHTNILQTTGKPENPGFVELRPARTRRSISRSASPEKRSLTTSMMATPEESPQTYKRSSLTETMAFEDPVVTDDVEEKKDSKDFKMEVRTSPEGPDIKKDISGHFEFGGAPGVTAMMIGFPLLMWYMWIGATYYDGKPPMRQDGESYGEFFKKLVQFVWTVSS